MRFQELRHRIDFRLLGFLDADPGPSRRCAAEFAEGICSRCTRYVSERGHFLRENLRRASRRRFSPVRRALW